jgi:hypothetical protein
MELAVRCPRMASKLGLGWIDQCNRSEMLGVESVTGGRICKWQDSSPLTAVRIFPRLGGDLLRVAATEWPFAFDDSEERRTSTTPEISVLIATGGRQRLPQLLITLACLRAQQDVQFEIIVVEIGPEAILGSDLPADVQHIHARTESSDTPFNKSWALNVGARAARGKLLALHDGDYLVPRQYLAKSRDILDEYEGARPHRFIFYMDQSPSETLCKSLSLPDDARVERVVANNPTPIITRAASYWSVGGHDESFFGWGGEDEEFLSRLRTRRFSEGGLMPVIHVWHPAAPKKANGDRNRATYEAIVRTPAPDRIARLAALKLGGVRPQPTHMNSAG